MQIRLIGAMLLQGIGGLKIIGEVQIHDFDLYKLKLKVSITNMISCQPTVLPKPAPSLHQL